MAIQKPTLMEAQENKRRGRLAQLLAVIQASEREKTTIDREKLLAKYMMDWMCSRRTLLEYLKVLEMNDKISINKNEIKFRSMAEGFQSNQR